MNDRSPAEGGTIGEILLRPHIYYGPTVSAARAAGEVRGMAHVTGGGIPGNLVRVLPAGVRADVQIGSWPVPEFFRFLQESGKVPRAEAFEIWNMGIGLILVVAGRDADAVERAIQGSGAACHRIGEIAAGEREVMLR